MSPSPREPGTARTGWSIRDVMVATAAAAVLIAGYRLEVGGSRGAGLVPACAFLVSCRWLRDARAARRAAGMSLGFVEVFVLAPLAGYMIVAMADVAFIMLAETTSLAIAISMIPDVWRRGGTADVVLMTSWGAFALICSIGPAILVAATCRRFFWRLALAPPPRGDVKPDPEPLPEPVPAGPIG